MTSESCAESCWKNTELGLGGFPCSRCRASPMALRKRLPRASVSPLQSTAPLCHLFAAQTLPSVGWLLIRKQKNGIKEWRKEQLSLQRIGARHSPCPTLQDLAAVLGLRGRGDAKDILGDGRMQRSQVEFWGVFGAVFFLPANQGHRGRRLISQEVTTILRCPWRGQKTGRLFHLALGRHSCFSLQE